MFDAPNKAFLRTSQLLAAGHSSVLAIQGTTKICTVRVTLINIELVI